MIRIDVFFLEGRLLRGGQIRGMPTTHDGVLNCSMRVFDVQAGASRPVYTHA